MGRMPDAWSLAGADTVGVTTGRQVTELIELGRDREAAELGGEPMDVLTQLDELAPLLGGVVGSLSVDDLDRPTPCASFSVRGVLEHMSTGALSFSAAFRGEAVAEPQPDLSDVLAAFGPALTDLGAAIASDGALSRVVAAPFGDVPGETFARFVVLDGLVHGWDLSRAVGVPYAPSDALVADVAAFAEDALPPLRDGGATFADAVEPRKGATPIERLAAFTGRQATA